MIQARTVKSREGFSCFQQVYENRAKVGRGKPEKSGGMFDDFSALASNDLNRLPLIAQGFGRPRLSARAGPLRWVGTERLGPPTEYGGDSTSCRRRWFVGPLVRRDPAANAVARNISFAAPRKRARFAAYCCHRLARVVRRNCVCACPTWDGEYNKWEIDFLPVFHWARRSGSCDPTKGARIAVDKVRTRRLENRQRAQQG